MVCHRNFRFDSVQGKGKLTKTGMSSNLKSFGYCSLNSQPKPLNKMWNAFTLTSLSDCFCKNDIRLFSFASVSVNMAVQKLVHTLKLYDGGEIDRFVLVHQGTSINYWRFLKKQPKFSSKIILALLPTCISYKMSIEVCIAESCIFLPSFLTGLS